VPGLFVFLNISFFVLKFAKKYVRKHKQSHISSCVNANFFSTRMVAPHICGNSVYVPLRERILHATSDSANH